MRPVPEPIDVAADCFFCGAELPALDPERLPAGERIAYDPKLGRLWRVCPECTRWNVVPLEDRWEVLERCERLVADHGELLLTATNLALYWIGAVHVGGQLVRVGEPTRLDYADWRYSAHLDEFPLQRRRGWIERLLALPERPVANLEPRLGGQYDAPGGAISLRWLGRPFVEHGTLLTGLFMDVPLAETCPSCGGPFVIEPQTFGDTRLMLTGRGPELAAGCGLCGDEGSVPLLEARPTLRAAIAIVERGQRSPLLVEAAAKPIDRAGGATGFLRKLAGNGMDMASLHEHERLALWFALDEEAEAEALEAEWRRAEELESIFDRDVSEVKGFDEFRARVLGDEARP